MPAKTAGKLVLAMLALWGLAGTASSAVQPPRVNPEARAVKEFLDRVQAYVALHKQVEGRLPPLQTTSDPAQIAARARALADAIRAARVGAKPGDIFTPAVSAQFRRIIREDLRRRRPRDARAAVEQIPVVPVRVNAPYPQTQPVATVPPVLLAKLQRLPEEMEYGFLGRALILRDIKANLIVDFIPNVVPATAP